MLPLLILVPLAAVVLLNVPVRSLRRLGVPLALAIAMAQAATVLWAPEAFWSRGGTLSEFFHFGQAAAGNLNLVMLLTIAVVLFAAVLVGNRMVRGELPRLNFVSLLLVATVGMNGVVTVTDLFSLYVFLEITSVASFVLIAFNRDSGGLEGAFKYIVLSAVATVLMLSAVATLLLIAGGTSFEQIASAMAAVDASPLAHLAIGAFVCGLFIKGGLVPFHGWLPAAYSAAPAPVSVLLAGVVTKVSGIYAMIALLGSSVFGSPNAVLAQAVLAVGMVSIIVGALAALGQGDMKRLLAYSSISQVGYIVLALGCAVYATANKLPAGVAALAMAGAVFHLFNHAIFKSLLFVNASAVEDRVGTTDMSRLGGLGARMPVSNVTSLVATLSTAGVPPLSGFWSKLIIVIALWQAGLHVYAVLAALLSVVTLGYLLVMQRRVFFGADSDEPRDLRRPSSSLAVAAVVLAAITLGLGLAFPWILNTFLLPVSSIF